MIERTRAGIGLAVIALAFALLLPLADAQTLTNPPLSSHTVQNSTARDALTNLKAGDRVHVEECPTAGKPCVFSVMSDAATGAAATFLQTYPPDPAVDNWIEITGTNQQLETGKHYTFKDAGTTMLTPPAPAAGEANWFVLRNDANALTGIQGTIIGPIVNASDGSTIPAFDIQPSISVAAYWDGAAWRGILNVPINYLIDVAANPGATLFTAYDVGVVSNLAGGSVTMEAQPVGVGTFHLTSDSTEPLIVNLSPSAPVGQQFCFEDDLTTGTTFTIPLSQAGNEIRIRGRLTDNCWRVYRPWVLDQVSNNVPAWKPSTAYADGDQVISVSPIDGLKYYYLRLGTAGPTSGAGTFDVTEAADWEQLGEAPISLPLLSNVGVTFRSLFSSFSRANTLRFYDGVGNAYDPTDWVVLSDTQGTIAPGTVMSDATDYSPLASNASRSVRFTYVGASQRRGLSQITVNTRVPGTVRLDAVDVTMGDGRIESAPASELDDVSDNVVLEGPEVIDLTAIDFYSVPDVSANDPIYQSDGAVLSTIVPNVCTDTATYTTNQPPGEQRAVTLIIEPTDPDTSCSVDGTVFTNTGDDSMTVGFFWNGTTATVISSAATPSGLPQQGEIPTAITAQGIYSANGTNTATTLPAATGSQDRVMIHATTAHGGTVISVQPGESLLRVVDTSYTTQAPGELLLFIDSEVGNWDMNIVGNAISVSSRVGEMFFAPAGSTRLGVLPVSPGTVTGGALAYPVWAAMYPEFISGDDIVFPPDVAGMFLRNLGGDAANEGVFQADRFRSHQHVGGKPVFGAEAAFGTTTGGGGNGGASNWDSSSTARPLTSFTGGDETNPVNRSYQLYVIVDNYDVRAMEGLSNAVGSSGPSPINVTLDTILQATAANDERFITYQVVGVAPTDRVVVDTCVNAFCEPTARQFVTVMGDGSGNPITITTSTAPTFFADQAASRYMDFGTMRMQWGIAAGAGATFPVPFKTGTTPSVTAVASVAGDNQNVTLQTVNETGFNTWIVRNENDVGIGAPVMHWTAFGLKP